MSKKNVLFISPEFFGIEKSLLHAMEDEGYHVIWHNERSICSSFSRALNSISSKFFENYSNMYYRKIISEINISLDIILIVKGDMVTEKTIANFRTNFPNAKLVLYLWDSVKNVKGILPKARLYDRVITFDPEDSEKYGFEFRALFCDVEKKVSNHTDKEEEHYDICFYGTMYGDRFHIVYMMREYCRLNNMSFYSFCFLRGKFMRLFYFLTNDGYRELGSKALSYKSKSAIEIAGILNASDIILDINDKYQKGLTIRTLETLISGKKMITTNADIVNYDFYNANNICVISRDNVRIPESFYKNKYIEIPRDILEKYTAKGWVKDVFGK